MTTDPLAGFPVVVTLPVAWGDMDSFGHVNNCVYFRYFEAARVAYLDRVGWMSIKLTTGHGPIVHSTSCRFRKPLAYPDTIRVGARVGERLADRVRIDHVLVSEQLGAVAAEGMVVVVNFDYRLNMKVEMSPALVQAIEEL